MQKHTDDELSKLNEEETIARLGESDGKMARVLEDAIRSLLKGGHLQLRDLPTGARDVLETRKKLRDHLDSLRGQ